MSFKSKRTRGDDLLMKGFGVLGFITFCSAGIAMGWCVYLDSKCAAISILGSLPFIAVGFAHLLLVFNGLQIWLSEESSRNKEKQGGKAV